MPSSDSTRMTFAGWSGRKVAGISGIISIQKLEAQALLAERLAGAARAAATAAEPSTRALISQRVGGLFDGSFDRSIR